MWDKHPLQSNTNGNPQVTRKRETIFQRVARHVLIDGSRATPAQLEQLFQAQDERHWSWTGAFHPPRTITASVRSRMDNVVRPVTRRPRPYLNKIGNPVRALLNMEGSFRRTRRTCPDETCVNPRHFQTQFYNFDSTRPRIDDLVELILEFPDDWEDEAYDYTEEEKALARVQAASLSRE